MRNDLIRSHLRRRWLVADATDSDLVLYFFFSGDACLDRLKRSPSPRVWAQSIESYRGDPRLPR